MIDQTKAAAPTGALHPIIPDLSHIYSFLCVLDLFYASLFPAGGREETEHGRTRREECLQTPVMYCEKPQGAVYGLMDLMRKGDYYITNAIITYIRTANRSPMIKTGGDYKVHGLLNPNIMHHYIYKKII